MVYSILSWILVRIDEVKKRAFVGRFLMPVDVPPEMLNGPVIIDTHEQVAGCLRMYGAV